MINKFKRLYNNSIRYNNDKSLIARKLKPLSCKPLEGSLRVLIIADIHGAFVEFKSDLEAFRARRIDFVVSLGDLTIDSMKVLISFCQEEGLPLYAIRGNHDMYDMSIFGDNLIDIDERIIEFRGFTFMGIEGSNYYNDYSIYKNDRELFEKEFNGHIDILFSHTKPYTITDKSLWDVRQGLIGINKILCNNQVRYHYYGHFHNKDMRDFIHGKPSKCIYGVELIKIKR